jgi:hypothetical protein
MFQDVNSRVALFCGEQETFFEILLFAFALNDLCDENRPSQNEFEPPIRLANRQSGRNLRS